MSYEAGFQTDKRNLHEIVYKCYEEGILEYDLTREFGEISHMINFLSKDKQDCVESLIKSKDKDNILIAFEMLKQDIHGNII